MRRIGVIVDTGGLSSQRVLTSSTLAMLSVLSWSVSLFVPAVDLGSVVAYGWQFLIYGWRGLAALNIGGLSWLANPLLLGAWLGFFALRGHRGVVLAVSLGAMFAALVSFLFNWLGSGSAGLRIEDFALGFHLWMGSTLLQAAAAVLRFGENRTMVAQDPEAADCNN